jgi:hypothetical protein
MCVSTGWGRRAGIEAELVPARKTASPITYLDVSGVRGQGIGRLLLAPFKVDGAPFWRRCGSPCAPWRRIA